MHMALVILAGMALLGLFVLFGWLWGENAPAMVLAGKVFVPAWLLVAAANMWVGVHHAGYSVREEFPILLVVFTLPAAAAGLLVWWLGRG